MTKRWISVTAEGETAIAPDHAVVSFAVTGVGKELAPTRDDVNARASGVLARLRELGVAEADITAPDMGIRPEVDYRTDRRLVGYRVERHLTARIRELPALGSVLDGVVSAGANEVGGARMAASDPAAAEHRALQAAVRAARAKAEAIASAAGVALGDVVRVEEEPGPGLVPMPRFAAMGAMAESSDVPTEIAPGELTVTRHIRAWFAIG